MLNKVRLFVFFLYVVIGCRMAKHEEIYRWETSTVYCAYTDRGNSWQKIPAIAFSISLPVKTELTEVTFSLKDPLKSSILPLQVNKCTVVENNFKNCSLFLKMETVQGFIEFDPENTCGFSELERVCNEYKLIFELKGMQREIQKQKGYQNIDGRILK